MKLDEYLFKSKKTQTKMARELGVNRQHFNTLVRGHSKPSLKLAKKIQDATGGQVTAMELLFPEEKK